MSNFVHGGHIRALSEKSGRHLDQILDFSANINPVGAPSWIRPIVSSALSRVIHYPDPDCAGLKQSAALRLGISSKDILFGNGSTELLYLLPSVLKKSRALIPVPSYHDYHRASEIASLAIDTVFLSDEDNFELDYDVLTQRIQGNEIVIVGHPNNPTGTPLNNERFLALIDQNPSTFFVIDEAFCDLSEGVESFVNQRPSNVLVLISLTKTYAIPGLRLGLLVADANIVNKIEARQPPWSVNSLAQAVGMEALKDSSFVKRSRIEISRLRLNLVRDLKTIPGFQVLNSRANFLLIKINRADIDSDKICRLLLEQGIAVRNCSNFLGLNNRFFRIAVRTDEENAVLVERLSRIAGSKSGRNPVRKTPSLMFQGTGSNAGKSILSAAFCRILLQDGFRVAPFKAQNMSLNSFVTTDGGEMGRAQAVQAQACRLEPDVRMNPILLKPNSDTGSQVIVNGKPVGNMDVMGYVAYKSVASQYARDAYDSLAREFDVMVLEGAGSPGEVNLKHHDIVNMTMAKYADSSVLLVGDIDRGGVFASFVGTMEVLEEWERSMVLGFLVNKFRGNEKLLDDAKKYTFDFTGTPVLGVIPYIHDLGLPEEDSVTFKSEHANSALASTEVVEIAVIDLPHISNFTDLDAFRIEPDVKVIIAREASDLHQPDAVILPGSKNVIGDLIYLEQRGFSQKLRGLSKTKKTEIVGICGGLQMLGISINDPHGLESDRQTISGLGLLNIDTVLELDKTLTRIEGTHIKSSLGVFGYEIHHGRSSGKDVIPLLLIEKNRTDGARSPDGMVWGTYVHGIFDSDQFRRWFIDELRFRKELKPLGAVQASYQVDPAIDRLAEIVRRSIKLDVIYEKMGI
jgi:adenosylcobyric acid synthase